ncbi:MAG: hypothetical protein ACTSRG_23135 [Candidatus Helarchaeota archaeon]
MEFEKLNLNNKSKLKKVLQYYLNLYPEKVDKFAPNHWTLTKELIKDGQNIINNKYNHESMLFLFLLKVGIWKNPHGRKMIGTITNIVKNKVNEIKLIFSNALDFYNNKIRGKDSINIEVEKIFIDFFGNIKGYGRTGARKLTSAILRFLDPSRYGTVDYRNWCILSNTGGQYFIKPLLESKGDSIQESMEQTISTDDFMNYLQMIRKLGIICNMSPAEIDMALFSFSDTIKPLNIDNKYLGNIKMGNHEKAQKILEIIKNITRGAMNGTPHWVYGAALGLQREMEKHAENGDAKRMYDRCRTLLGGKVGKYLQDIGKNSIESEFSKIERIYKSD